MALSDAEINPYKNCSYPPQFPNQDTTIALFFFFFYAYIYNQEKKKKKKERMKTC
jgi:hypothetical protein